MYLILYQPQKHITVRIRITIYSGAGSNCRDFTHWAACSSHVIACLVFKSVYRSAASLNNRMNCWCVSLRGPAFTYFYSCVRNPGNLSSILNLSVLLQRTAFRFRVSSWEIARFHNITMYISHSCIINDQDCHTERSTPIRWREQENSHKFEEPCERSSRWRYRRAYL